MLHMLLYTLHTLHMLLCTALLYHTCPNANHHQTSLNSPGVAEGNTFLSGDKLRALAGAKSASNQEEFMRQYGTASPEGSGLVLCEEEDVDDKEL